LINLWLSTLAGLAVVVLVSDQEDINLIIIVASSEIRDERRRSIRLIPAVAIVVSQWAIFSGSCYRQELRRYATPHFRCQIYALLLPLPFPKAVTIAVAITITVVAANRGSLVLLDHLFGGGR
jgi:hypothetical protein